MSFASARKHDDENDVFCRHQQHIGPNRQHQINARLRTSNFHSPVRWSVRQQMHSFPIGGRGPPCSSSCALCLILCNEGPILAQVERMAQQAGMHSETDVRFAVHRRCRCGFLGQHIIMAKRVACLLQAGPCEIGPSRCHRLCAAAKTGVRPVVCASSVPCILLYFGS